MWNYADWSGNSSMLGLIITTTILWPFFRDHSREPVPEESFWTLQCKGRLTEAETLTIQLGAPSGLTSTPPPSPIFYRPDAIPATQPTVSKHLRQLSAERNTTIQLEALRQCIPPPRHVLPMPPFWRISKGSRFMSVNYFPFLQIVTNLENNPCIQTVIRIATEI